MKSVCRSMLLVAALFAVPAFAQNYIVTSVVQPYVALTGAGVTTIPSSSWTTTGSWPYPDDAVTTVPLGFTFPYYGNTYTDVTISTNGVMGFGTVFSNDCASGCSWNGGTIPATSRTPHNLIAPWWDDLKGNSTGGVRYSHPNPSEIVIEYYDWNEYSGSASFNFEVRLNASGLIQVHYGPKSGSFNGAVVGFEDSTGGQGGVLFACGSNGNCSDSNWVPNTLFTIGQPVQPDLMVQSVNLNSTSRNGTSLSVSVSPTFRNLGQNDATNFHWKAYLSTDTTLDASDSLIYDSSVANAPVTVLGANNTTNPTATATGSGTLSNVSNANYYVLVDADTTNVVAEFSENNNLGSTLAPFTFGVDLVADAISGPTQSGPGNMVTWNLGWHNAGTDQPTNNPQTYQIIISTDQTLSSNDMVAATWTENVAGGQSCSGSTCTVTLPLNTNLPGGDFYWGLLIDPGMTSGDVDFNNNAVFSSAMVHLEQADLEMQSVDFVDNNTLQPTRAGFIGGTGTAKVTIKNIGGADARDFKIGVILSKDSTPTLLSDTLIHSEPVALLAAGDTQTYTITFDIPTVDKKGVAYTSGSYFLFMWADINGDVTELSEYNNSKTVNDGGSDQPINLRTPAPDYAVLKVDAPSTAAVGEMVPVYRVLRNVGNADGVQVSYRYFASVNDIVSDEDVPLPILGTNGQMLDNGQVTLTTGETDSQTEFVRLPPTMPAGTWYIGVVVDVGNAMAELDETNNAGSTSSVVQVAPSAMRITNQQLPDATMNVPYAFRLSTTGATGPVTWTTEDPLPAGLSLSKTDGVISGTPTETSITAFTVLAESGTQSTASRLVMRVLPTTGELAVATQNLPPVVSDPNVPYVADLAAAGGTRPYTWKILSGVLPNGIRMDTAGHLTGAAKPGVPVGETQLVVQVADVNGNSARAQLKIKVVEPGALVISTLALPDTMVNADYIADLAAKNADGTTISGSLSWSIISGRLPEGLALTVQANVVGLLTGKAIESGTFPFTLQVVDEKGRSDVADFILRVFPARLKLSAVNAPTVVHPGDKVSFQITTGTEDSRYHFYSGALPPGLSIDENGTVAGTVETENSVGTWNYVVEADSATSGQSLGAFSMEVTPAPVKTGCSTTPGEGGGFGLLALLAPLAALLARRRRGAAAAVAAMAAVALVGAPGSASAQSTTNYYEVSGPKPLGTYQALSGGQLLTVDQYSTGATVTIPFNFEFYGKQYTSIGVSLHGYASFSNALNDYHWSSSTGIPYNSTSYPPNIIAPWWGELNKTGGTTVKAGTIGAAPNREFVVEWNNVCNSYSCTSTGKFSMQVHLYEGSNRIRFAYGTGTASSNSAVGIQGSPGVGIAGLTCTNSNSGNCSNSSFPSGKVVDFALPPDLQISGLSVDNIGYVGVPQSAVAAVINKGGLDALPNGTSPGSVVRFYLSRDAFFDETEDTELGDSSGQTVKVLETVAHTASLTIPSSVEPGDYYLFAKVDPDKTINEGDKEGNNVTPPMPFTVGEETPNLALASISGPSMLNAGGMVALTGTVINSGNADTAAPAKVSYFVSDNSVVTVSDVLLGTGDVPVVTAPNGTQQLSESFALPSDLPAGKYWVGACVDYDPSATPKSAITEISEVDNCLTGNSFILNTGAVAVVTSSLPGATQNGPYGLRLEAIGGDGNYTWSLAGGALPTGMSLSSAGDLFGTPSEAGSFSFTVKVSSAMGDATKDLTLEVAAFNQPLTIVDQELPGAEFGRGYATQLVAKGGHPPYQWSLQQGTKLPEGLGLSSDGFVEGRAAQARDTAYMFTVSVKDADGTEAARDLSIRVVLPSSMHIATSRLKTAYIGSNYSQDLQAIGGAGQGFTWSVVRFERLAQDPTDVPGAVEAKLPDGFGLAIQQGNANTPTRLTGKPNQAGLYAVTLMAFDNFSSDTDTTTLPLLVSYDKPLAITTTVLPDAFVGSNYNVKVSHNLNTEAGVTFSNPCVQQASSTAGGFTYNCVAADASQQLPAGLSLGSDGAITGIPTALPGTPTEANSNVTVDPVVYSFLVKATDSQGRTDVRSLSIKVRPAPVEKTGCSGTGLEPAALALMAFAGSLLRRRRK